ncbi:hypothetical protein DPMN_183511 [Dreissena polymorpha]|uniref:Uncharacterized protein n=1 Tax=Dreissena polymorpha TaxID=45954 RepID=A0A9D4I727_DREPO|nr:hypothetical protein DPMN_183511 [Dreissena polymorpha]
MVIAAMARLFGLWTSGYLNFPTKHRPYKSLVIFIYCLGLDTSKGMALCARRCLMAH